MGKVIDIFNKRVHSKVILSSVQHVVFMVIDVEIKPVENKV